jgi:flagellar P-ring protein precursor FlgI
LIERGVPTTLTAGEQLVFSLYQPDFATAGRLARAINTDLGAEAAWAEDAGRVTVRIPPAYQGRVPELIARLGDLRVTPDAVAKVVVNERTGTVVVGGEVTILPVAAAHAGLTAEISTRSQIVPPPPLSTAQTVVAPESSLSIKETQVPLQELRGATVQDLIRSLNAIKATPRDIIAILQAIKRAGALQAELEVI